MAEVRIEYNPAIFLHRFTNIPKCLFNNFSFVASEASFVKTLNEHFNCNATQIQGKSYFKAPERIFIEYDKDNLKLIDIRVLLAFY